MYMYLIEQFPMGCLENKYFSLDLIFPVGWFSTKPSGIIITYYMSGVVVVEIFKQTLTLLCSLSTKQTKVKFCLNWTKGRWFHIGQRFFGRR